jgi:hypothetical protein
MAMVGLYFALEITVLFLWPSGAGAALPFVIGGFVLKAAGAWLGAGGIAARALSKA